MQQELFTTGELRDCSRFRQGNDDDAQYIKERFNYFFKCDFSLFKDKIMSCITGIITLDVIKFDKYLRYEYCEEYPDNISMNDFIEMQFGVDALKFINQLT